MCLCVVYIGDFGTENVYKAVDAAYIEENSLHIDILGSDTPPPPPRVDTSPLCGYSHQRSRIEPRSAEAAAG